MLPFNFTQNKKRSWKTIAFFLSLVFSAYSGFSQTSTYYPGLPSASSCTSKDLELVGASLPVGNVCNPSGTYSLYLSINNKTGSLRTSFALWGTLVRTSSTGVVTREGIKACASGIQPSSINTLKSDKSITIAAGESLVIEDLMLAWTTSNSKENCAFLDANYEHIAPKCGNVPSIRIDAGLNGIISQSSSACSSTQSPVGTIVVAPYGGTPPYSVAIQGQTTQSNIAAGGTAIFTNLPAGVTYYATITDSRNPACSQQKSITLQSPANFTANAGSDVNIYCNTNTNGVSIGETTVESGYSYTWSPATGLYASNGGAAITTSTNIKNPWANPSSTTTYTLTKTNTSTGCIQTDQITVTVNKTTPTADAGLDKTLNCTNQATGVTIGTSDVTSGFSYSWNQGISATTPSVTVTPASTTTYILTKTNTTTGCSATDNVTVTVDKTAPLANAGPDVTLNCNNQATGVSIGSNDPTSGYSYSWNQGVSATTPSVTVTPSSTTTYTLTRTNTTNGCSATDDVTVTVDVVAPIANAGPDVTLDCRTEGNAVTIGSNDVTTGFSYSWNQGVSATTSSVTVSPSSSTIYTLTKTNTTNGCSATDNVTVNVNKQAPAANAGDDFTKTCITNANGKQIGTTSAAGLSYSWSPSTGLSATNISNPTANPSASQEYTLLVTRDDNGCSATDKVMVTVNNTATSFTVCVAQPTLCSTAGGSVTFNATGTGLQYSINNGSSWSSNASFTGLGAGAVTGLKVKNDYGCETTVSCENIVSNCTPQSQAAPVKPEQQQMTATLAAAPVTADSKTNSTTGKPQTKQITVKAYPNPFSNKLSFAVNSPFSGFGSIELFNMQGQKISTIYQGRIPMGSSTYEYQAHQNNGLTYVYVLRVGDKMVSGRVINAKR